MIDPRSGKVIIRVFPYRTSFTPTDDYAFIGPPPFRDMIPDHDEVHVSCTFTWDREYCRDLAFQWEIATRKPVKLGGPAFLSEARDFVPGLYVRNGVIFTSRGCNNNCSFCGVRRIEGKLIELPVYPGNIIQDNNFLQTSAAHKQKVFQMLKTQKHICFRGGLEAGLVTDDFVSELTSLSIAELWLACDTDASLPAFRRACEKFVRAGFRRDQIRCYSLIGHDMEKEEARNREIWRAGAMPFSQLQMDFSDKKTEYSKEWHDFARLWQRPAIMRAHMKNEEEK